MSDEQPVSRSVVGRAPVARRGGRIAFVVAVIVLTVGLGAVWSFLAHRQLQTAIATSASTRLGHAHAAFQSLRSRTQDQLKALCRVMVEDPRLKSTLATEGIDAATVADILNDLGKLRGAGFLLVLTPEGRVFAEAGAPELKDLDLASSAVVKKAQEGSDVAVGAWVLGGQVKDLAIMAIRFGDETISYLAVGQAVNAPLMKEVASASGVGVATALGTTLGVASDESLKPVFSTAAAEAGGYTGRTLTMQGQTYVTAVFELAETAQSHRLVLVSSLADAKPPFADLEWLLFVPPGLVLLAVLFSLSGSRSPRRAS